MKNFDVYVNVLGLAYGLMLVMTMFVRTSITEAMRVDALFMSKPSEGSRPLNLVVGLLVAGYAVYSLTK